MRANSNFKAIPIVVLSTSNAPSDIKTCYELGANSFITKPSSFEGYSKSLKIFNNFGLLLLRCRNKKQRLSIQLRPLFLKALSKDKTIYHSIKLCFVCYLLQFGFTSL
jgi:CheY-like chemotaxis protein